MKVPNFLKLCAFLALTCELQALPLAVRLEFKCADVKCQAGEKCQRVGGKPICVGPSDGLCRIDGSKHKTFDGVSYDFKGSCTYTIAKTCDNNNNLHAFEIKARNGNRGNSQDSYLDDMTVEVKYPQQKYVISWARNDNGSIKVNADSRQRDFTLYNKIQVFQTSNKVVIETDFQLTFKYYRNSKLEIYMPSSFSKNVCGMCGNYNGNPSDDFATPSGTQAAGPVDFGESWKVNADSRQRGFDLYDRIQVFRTSNKVAIQTDFGIRVMLGLDSKLEIYMPSSFSKNVVGLCGNYNGNPSDDFATPSGTQAAGPDDFGESWKVNDGENSSGND